MYKGEPLTKEGYKKIIKKGMNTGREFI